MQHIVKFDEVNEKIIHLKGQHILLDSDVADLYGVATKEINQAVKNNPEKFPEEYIFTLTTEEKNELVKNFDRFNNLKHATVIPKAFTEKGLYMLATIIKGQKATQTTIAIIETFARFKHLVRNIRALSDIKDEKQKQNLLKKSGEIIAEILDDDMTTKESETSIEVNFAILKFKHTIKKKNKKG